MLAVLLGTLLLAAPPDTSWEHEALRARMVEQQIAARDVSAPAVLDAMRSVPRHRFVPDVDPELAYADRPLPIGHSQTISQPYIVARMTELVRPDSTDRVLEIG
ncbi:MAG: protein-L-isoaspartate O-methyltransferase, partial [Bacteroidetes bacterium QS_4_64_154]